MNARTAGNRSRLPANAARPVRIRHEVRCGYCAGRRGSRPSVPVARTCDKCDIIAENPVEVERFPADMTAPRRRRAGSKKGRWCGRDQPAPKSRTPAARQDDEEGLVLPANACGRCQSHADLHCGSDRCLRSRAPIVTANPGFGMATLAASRTRWHEMRDRRTAVVIGTPQCLADAGRGSVISIAIGRTIAAVVVGNDFFADNPAAASARRLQPGGQVRSPRRRTEPMRLGQCQDRSGTTYRQVQQRQSIVVLE